MGTIHAQATDVAFLLEKNSFYIPPYQRGYAWTIETSKQLLSDLMNHLENDPEGDYFVGNIIVYQNRDKLQNQYVVVDGQQRITTFMLMLTALRISLFSSPTVADTDKEKLDEMISRLVLDEPSRGEKENKVKLFSSRRKEIVTEIVKCNLTNSDLSRDPWLKKISIEYNDTNYYKNLEQFITIFNRKFEDYDDYIEFLRLLERVKFVLIDISDDKSVHIIFEKINSAGVDLTLTDLTKNYLYILLESIKDESVSNDHILKVEKNISDIFENKITNLKNENNLIITNYLVYLMKKHYNKKREKEVYIEFKKFVNKELDNGNLTIDKIINELNEQTSLISYIEKFGKAYSTQLYDVAIFLNKDNLTGTLFPFIYAVAKMCDVFEEGEFIVNGDFEDFIILMDKFFTRRYIVNSSNKNYNKYVSTLLNKLSLLDTFDIGEIEFILTNDEEETNGSLMPNRNELLSYFKNNNSPYKSNNPKELKQIFFRINYFMTNNSNESIALDDSEYKKFSIEHIMPQKPNRDSIWILDCEKDYNELADYQKNEYGDFNGYYESRVHNWGNLTITQDNSKLSNDDFHIKKDIFINSTLRINSDIANKSQWTIDEIKSRKENLINIIKEHF